MANLCFRSFLVFMLLSVLGAFAHADTEEQLRKYVDDNTQRMVEQLNRERDLFKTDPEAFYRSMDQSMEGFVDFRRFAARVMGRHARQATPAQRDEFVTKLKRSLFERYGDTLMDTRNFRIEVQEAKINPRDENRAAVNMQVITESNKRYQITYSMYLAKSGQWMMENVIVEGVNMGLSFRDWFGQEMEANRDQIQMVIDGWSDVVGEKNLEQLIDDEAEQK